MPILKNLSKLQKKKADSKLHPKGRKLKQLTTAELRHLKIEKTKERKDEAQEKRLERHLYVQALCQKLEKPSYTIDELRIMCQEFIDRNKEELNKLEQERRPGRPPSTKYQKMKMLHEIENKEFEDGFTIVDVTDPVIVTNLLRWNGSWGGLNTLKTIRVSRN